MRMIERIEYTLKAMVGGAGLGLAILGGISFFTPAVSATPVVFSVTLLCSVGLSIYTFKYVD